MSILGYDNLFNALNLGIGSTISILIFICVAIIAVIFILGLRHRRARLRHRERGDGAHGRYVTCRQAAGRLGDGELVVIALALIPVLWLLSLSFKTPSAVTRPVVLARRSGPGGTTAGS